MTTTTVIVNCNDDDDTGNLISSVSGQSFHSPSRYYYNDNVTLVQLKIVRTKYDTTTKMLQQVIRLVRTYKSVATKTLRNASDKAQMHSSVFFVVTDL